MLPVSPIPELRIVELDKVTEPLLQQFFEENPLYFEVVHGEPPREDEAHKEIFDEPPAGWSYTKKWVIAYLDHRGRIMAMANILSDSKAPNVWLIASFIVATEWHGSGKALSLYTSLEQWIKSQGAIWLRLGVVVGNERAEHFWLRRGYVEVVRREGVEIGRRINSVRIMVKSLYGQELQEHIDLMAQTQPTTSNVG